MRTGHRSRSALAPHGIAGFQFLRVCVVMGLAAAGGFALSLTLHDQSAVQEKTLAASQQDAIHVALHVSLPADQTDRAAALQVASADASDLIAGDTMAAAVPSEPSQVKDDARILSGTSLDHAAASPSGDAPPRETEQASSDPSALAASDMIDAVNVASTASIPAQDSELVDLNTASFEQLNTLRNAGPLGRAIIKGRPYASVEDLVKRKVMRRSVYEKVKDQVTVRQALSSR